MNIDESDDRDLPGTTEGLQKKIIELQMQLMAKTQQCEHYSEEIDNLNTRMRRLGGGDGSNCKASWLTSVSVNEIYKELEDLTRTIEQLKVENSTLRQSLNALGNQSDPKNSNKDEMDQLVDKIQHLEKRIKTPLEDGMESSSSRYLARIAELESHQHQLTKQLVELEDKDRVHHREVEAVENERDRVADQLQKVISDHEVLKSKSLDLLKRNGVIEAENEILRKEKSQLVDNILGLQKSHQDEIQSLRFTLESLGEKLYVVGLDSESKQTLTDLETRHTTEKKNWGDKARSYQENVERLEREVASLEAKMEEQHQVIVAYSKVESTLHSEQRRLAELTDECEDLKSEVRALEQAKDQSESKASSLHRELDRTKQDLAGCKDELDAVTSVKADLLREKQSLTLKVSDI